MLKEHEAKKHIRKEMQGMLYIPKLNIVNSRKTEVRSCCGFSNVLQLRS
jgi:hypothetical protein